MTPKLHSILIPSAIHYVFLHCGFWWLRYTSVAVAKWLSCAVSPPEPGSSLWLAVVCGCVLCVANVRIDISMLLHFSCFGEYSMWLLMTFFTFVVLIPCCLHWYIRYSFVVIVWRGAGVFLFILHLNLLHEHSGTEPCISPVVLMWCRDVWFCSICILSEWAVETYM